MNKFDPIFGEYFDDGEDDVMFGRHKREKKEKGEKPNA